MAILVTGSSGYVGSYLVPALQARGHTLVGIDRDMPEVNPPDVFIQGDLMEEAVLQRGFAHGIDLLVHLAAAKDDWGLSEAEFYRDNVQVTEQLLSAARQYEVHDHVFYSTVAVHGPSHEPIDEAAPLGPIIAYGASKVACEEQYRQLAADDPAQRITIVRPSVIFGPRHPWNTNIYRLIDAISKNRFVMIGKGDALKTTSYIENLVAATLFLLDRQEKGVQVYTYVDAPVWSTGTLVSHIYDMLDRPQPRWSLPLGLVVPVAYAFDVAGWILRINFPITAARIKKFNRSTNFAASAIREIGFEQPVSNKEALLRTLSWQIEAIST